MEGNALFNDTFNTFYLRLYATQISRDESRCCQMGYYFRLAARCLKYVPSHRQANTYHGLCYTSRGALAGTINSSMRDRSDEPSHHERTLYHGASSRIQFG